MAVPLGRPLQVAYPVPPGWTAGQLASSESFAVISQQGGLLTIVPLSLDTLQLPPLTAWSGADTLVLQSPPVVVDRTLPDTIYAVSPFPAPAQFLIPPGLPEDYLSALRFWMKWGSPPRPFPWLPAIAASLVLSAAAILTVVARRRRAGAPSSAGASVAADPSASALALLESREFVSGDWKALFREIDILLRRCVGERFGADPTALTWRQIASQISGSARSKEFMEDSADLLSEIRLQRYAGWGSSREKAEAWIRGLARILSRWMR
jgi:hypothetical protein